jgi:hypothetical protein
MRVKAIQYAVNSVLPPELRDYQRPLDGKGIERLMHQVAVSYPDKYAEVLRHIGDLGRNAAYWQGETMGLDDLRDVIDTPGYLRQMDTEVDAATRGLKDPQAIREAREGVWHKWASKLERDTMTAALVKNNAIGESVASGARGKPVQARAMLSTPAIFEDSQGRTIPLFARSSYSQGVSPGAWLAGTYGARKAVVSTKVSTAKGGFLAKMLTQVAAPLIVTEPDCGTTNGIDLSKDAPDLRNRFLAAPAGGLDGGSLLDRKGIAQIKNKFKGDTILVRSALTCQAPRGVCAKCIGADPRGQLHRVGYAAGITASNALGEPACLHGSTLVRMADGSVRPITAIRVGDMVLGADIQGVLRPTRVMNTFVNGMRHCFRTVVRKGFGAKSDRIELISTAEHKVLSFKGKRHKKAYPTIASIEMPAEVNPQHSVYMAAGCPDFVGVVEPWAMLLGALTGDGCYTGGKGSDGKGIGFSCYDQLLTEDMQRALHAHGLKLSGSEASEFRVNMQDQYSAFEYIDGKLVRNKLRAVLIKEGMWGQYSGEKTPPRNIQRWDNASVAAYIGGLLATDGWITTTGSVAGFSSNSQLLLQTVKDLCELRFGIYGSRIIPKYKRKKGTQQFYAPTFEFTICGAENMRKLFAHIPVPGCKQARLQKKAQEPTKTRMCAGRFTVLEQVYYGFEMTYDIEVDNDTHLFALANGLVVSNTQAALREKHTSGAASKKASYSGLDWLQRFVQVPDSFPDRAPVAEQDGTVTVMEAPQGGHYVHIGDQEHYVPANLEVTVKTGERVEAGQPLSEGVVRPDDVVRLRGVGEGRRYYSDRLGQMFADSGFRADPRNVELIARAAVDHVQIDDPEDLPDGVLPDDTVQFGEFMRNYEPAEGSQIRDIKEAAGQYLQQPALHYTPGTKLTGSMVERLGKAGISKIMTNEKAPPFHPAMVRLQTSSFSNPDWLASLSTSYLGKQLATGAARGQDTNIEHNIHFAPRLAVGVDFGKNIETTGEF